MKREARLSLAQGQLMLWILAGSVLAVAAMLAFFKVTGVPHVPIHSEVPRIEWMPAARSDRPTPDDELYVIADVLDPSLMSLPSPHGFSSDVWKRKSEATQRDLGWNEKPAYLEPMPPDPLRSLLEPAPLSAAVLWAAEKTPAQPEESDDEIIQSPVTVNQSVLRVLGPLANRGVIRTPELPAPNNPTPMRAAQVRIGVGADGLVRYALIDRSCGSESVDAQAVVLARQIRFEAEQGSEPTALTWGIVRFLWATQAGSTTNGESAAAPP
jgi:hypothetical protein